MPAALRAAAVAGQRMPAVPYRAVAALLHAARAPAPCLSAMAVNNNAFRIPRNRFALCCGSQRRLLRHATSAESLCTILL